MSQYQAPDMPRSNANKMVWVVSDIKSVSGYPEKEFWYEEKFRGDMLRIPPDGKKRVLMHFLAAHRFLGQVQPPQNPYPNGSFINQETGLIEKDRFGKPLRIVELSAEEMQKYEGKSPKQAMDEIALMEKELSNKKHTTDGQNVIAVGTGKPQAHKEFTPSADVPLEEIQRIDS